MRKKRKQPLNKNRNWEIYYPITIDWLKKYIEYYKLSDLYKNQIINQTFENIIFNSIENLSNEIIIENAKLQTEFCQIINNFSNKIISNKYQFNVSSKPNPNYIKDIKYYKNFFLASEDTIKSFPIDYNIKSFKFYCYFGDNKIFIVFNGPQAYLIEIYYFDKFYDIIPEIFLKFNGDKELSNSLSLLIENGYYQYGRYYLLFEEKDEQNISYTSPIFDKDNREIGLAIKFDNKIKDYSQYIIDNEYKAMVKLYFNYIKFKSKSIREKTGKYYLLINHEFIKTYKDYYYYSTLENYLPKNKFSQQAAKNINENIDYVLNDKILTLIIMNLPNDINKKFIETNKYPVQTISINEEPNLKAVHNTNLYYYDEFELIDKELYSSIFKKNNINVQGECYFINSNICIKLPNQLNNDNFYPSKYIFGALNQKNIFNAKFLLEFKTENDFKKYYQFTNNIGGFDTFLNAVEFKNSNMEKLKDLEGNIIGNIYNLVCPPVPPAQTNLPIGLKNVGATCYMNATLQCLSQINKLVDYFLKDPFVNKTIEKYRQNNKNCLTKSFKFLIDNLWPSQINNYHMKNSNNYYFAPTNFKEKISKMNPLFEGVQANDAKDLVNFILMTLHEELNVLPKRQIPVNLNMKINQTNWEFMLNNFKNIFFGENKSIISDLFYGISHTITKCSNCPYYKHNYEAYFFLNFPLEEVRKYKIQELSGNNNNFINQNMMNMNPMMNQMMNNPMMNPMMNMNNMNQMNIMNMNQNMLMNQINQMNMNAMQGMMNNANKINLLQNNIVDIYDCFDYNQKIENFFGENAMYCDICNKQLPSTFQTILHNCPNILILVLNRGQGIQFKVKLNFNLELNLYNYIEDKNSGYIYELIGVVTHMGESGSAGHFIATCKSPKDRQWYQFNDDLVFPVTNFQQQLLNYAMPYILFFKKINQNFK